MPVISVIVPVYNAEKLLTRCMDSILAQTFSDYELMLVDDGSTDQSGTLCDMYAAKYPHVRVIHQENRGQATARNRAIKLSGGEWIAFVDADDMIHPQYLELLYRAVKDQDVQMSICHIYEGSTVPEWFWAEQRYNVALHLLDQPTMIRWMQGECNDISQYAYWTVWGKLIHRSVLQKYPFEDNRIYEDNAVVCKWLYEAQRVAFCNSVMYFYYVNHEGTTKKKYTLKRLDWLWAVQEHIRFYQENGCSEMVLVLKKRYVWEALREYENVTQLLGNQQAANRLRHHILGYILRWQRDIQLSYSGFMEVFSRLYPELIRKILSSRRRRGE